LVTSLSKAISDESQANNISKKKKKKNNNKIGYYPRVIDFMRAGASIYLSDDLTAEYTGREDSIDGVNCLPFSLPHKTYS